MDNRKLAFDNISRILAITRYDIEQHQLINDQSLNIHGENWFRDIFNYIYETNFINTNFLTKNAPATDLVDENKKLAYQITTTRTKDKVINTLSKISPRYKGYKILIFFLLDKSKFTDETKKYFKDEFNVEIDLILKDYTDLLKDIETLETDKIIELNKKYFSFDTSRYTEEIVLNFIFKHIIKEQQKIKKDFNEDFGNIDLNSKIKLNSINERISTEIKKGSDYRSIIEEFSYDDNTLEDLRYFIIDDLYKKILVELLSKKVSMKILQNKKSFELQDIASQENIDFNQIINKLHQSIENYIEIKDFNSINVAWIVISYFFEICDIGVDEEC